MFPDDDDILGPDEEWCNIMGHRFKVKKQPTEIVVPHIPEAEEIIEREKADMRTSYGRFYQRIPKFQAKYRRFPRVIHHFWWLVHNITAHIAIALMPIKATFKFHDWTSKKLNAG